MARRGRFGRVRHRLFRTGILLLTLLAGPASTIASELLVARGSTWRYRRGTAEASSPIGAWRQPEFQDGAWASGPAPFRYGDGAGGTVLGDMRYNYTTLFLRRKFQVVDVSAFDVLSLMVNYDDGFLVWINGIELETVNAPAVITHDALATGTHESGVFESFTIADPSEYLSNGSNLICVQVFNVTIDSSDLLMDLEIIGAPAVADTKFSVDRGIYDTPFDMEITTETPGATIRYTTNGAAPLETRGTVYQGAIRIDGTTTLRAMAYKAGLVSTNVDTQTYIFLADVLTQARPAGYPASLDYAMDLRVVNDPDYSGEG